MLFEEYQHGLIEHMHITIGRFLRAFSFIMQYSQWQIPVVITLLKQAVRQVYVLSIHEEIFVEQAHILECFTRNGEKSTADDFYLSWLIPG